MSIFDRLVKKNPKSAPEKDLQAQRKQLVELLHQNAEQDRASRQELGPCIDAFFPRLQQRLSAHVDRGTPPPAGDGQEPLPLRPVDGALEFYVAPDRMTAYICLFPPLNGGAPQGLPSILEDLRYAGIVNGIDEARITQALRDEAYLRILPAARGAAPVDGQDGTVTEFFQRQAPVQLEAAEGAVLDFSATQLFQPVCKGDVICRIQPPVPAQAGLDVTGRPLPGRDGAAVRMQAGANVRLSEDGQLLADIDGVVFSEGEGFSVLPQKIILGDVCGADVHVDFKGDLYIGGNVDGGACVEVSGNLVVEGEVRDGCVKAGGFLRVQKGVRGCGKASLQAGRQLQCSVLEDTALAEAGGSIFTELIAASTVVSGKAVYVMGGRGLILGAQVTARDLIAAKKIGNLSGTVSHLAVGVCRETEEELKPLEAELAQVQAALEKLRKSIGSLRAAGQALSLEKRALLSQLAEQRALYEEKEKSLQAQVKDLKRVIAAALTGKITCQEFNPVAEVQIGSLQATLQLPDTNCSIHAYMGRIVTK